MGTNYYVHINSCSKCGRPDRKYHIGKSSAGWCFSLHVEPLEGTNDLSDVQNIWKGNTIQDEYGEVVTPDDMMDIITNRSWGKREGPGPWYVSWDDFHVKNHSEAGPNNMVRHKVDGKHCIGHGDGTYDYIVGEFS